MFSFHSRELQINEKVSSCLFYAFIVNEGITPWFMVRKARLEFECLWYSVVPYSFSSVAHVCVPGAKTTVPIAKNVCFFLNVIFSAVRNFNLKFQYDPFSNLKGPFPNYGACQKRCVFYFCISFYEMM
jgi:hypothetical protein